MELRPDLPVTPWGTWLTCEENFHGYFMGRLHNANSETHNAKRYGVPGNQYAWGKWHSRFDVSKEANEANRFGWVVEIDPFDPKSTPKKRPCSHMTSSTLPLWAAISISDSSLVMPVKATLLRSCRLRPANIKFSLVYS